MNERSLTQRELASKIDIAHSLLNAILNGNRNINVSIALSLEAANFKDADFWLKRQLEYTLAKAKSDKELMKKNQSIKTWNELDKDWVPILYFRKKKSLGVLSPEDLDKLYEVYDVKSIESLKKKIQNFPLTFFRKSSKFKESRQNVVAWSILAEHLAKKTKAKKFDASNEALLIKELKKCFYNNVDTVEKTGKILNKHGIKFFVLDRPNKTPVDGKSFMSGDNPAIVLTLKYKRLDNFAFTIMHELGHVFLHLTKAKYKDANFFVNNAETSKEEQEANTYARNHLINLETWNDFLAYEDFEDDAILELSEQIKVHPAIIRGRVCFEFNEYYRRRTVINAMNIIS